MTSYTRCAYMRSRVLKNTGSLTLSKKSIDLYQNITSGFSLAGKAEVAGLIHSVSLGGFSVDL